MSTVDARKGSSPAVSGRAVRAVFFTDVSACSAHHIDTWLKSGHEAAACVISYNLPGSQLQQERWRALLASRFSLRGVCRRNGIALMRGPRDLAGTDFLTVLRQLHADVLISVAFPHLIPDEVTACFRCGGVNVHPSLLPEYRGPHPVQTMAVDGALERCAGVTLHRISSGFDEGDIIAQAGWRADDFAEPEWHGLAYARIGPGLLERFVPAYCAGEVTAEPQPQGAGRYARLEPSDLMLSADMDLATLAARTRVLASTRKLRVTLGDQTFRIARYLDGVPERSGSPPRVTWNAVEFDAVDGRVSLRRLTSLEKWMQTLRLLRRLRKFGLQVAGRQSASSSR
jgi:methionyl-tRNA formyltransferase